MGRKPEVLDAPPRGSLTWRLSDPGMDLLERAGLAGLYMALRAASERGVTLAPLDWRVEDLQPDSVTVRWTDTAKPAFERLVEWAWQVREGVLFLPAVHGAKDAAMLQNRIPMHNGIMRTFLQHTNVQPKGEPVTKIVTLDEGQDISMTFQPPVVRTPKSKSPETRVPKRSEKKLLKPWKDIGELFDRQGDFQTEHVALSNWVYPGIAGRYSNEVAWRGLPQRALLLMLAPTACLFLRLQGQGGNWAFVIPDICDLEDFDTTRRLLTLNADFVDVASLSDAGLQFLAEYSTRNPRKRLSAGCRVVAMGKVTYYASQSIRKAVLDIPPDMVAVTRYRLLHREMPNIYVALKSEPSFSQDVARPTKRQTRKIARAPQPSPPPPAGFIRLPAARGRIAENLVRRQPWYTDLLVPLIWNMDEAERERKKLGGSLQSAWFRAVCYQRSKLMKLIAEDDMWDSEAEKLFVTAFWETLDALYAQEAAAIERGGSRTATERFDDLNDEIRRRLMQAKTRTLLRSALADLFGKAGRQRSIRAHPAAVWRLIDDSEQWRKGRDLALLALASHRKREDRELAAASRKEPNQ